MKASIAPFSKVLGDNDAAADAAVSAKFKK